MSDRVLRLVDPANAFEREGDSYILCEFLFHSFLAKCENKYEGFVTSKAVSGAQASALAGAIERIEQSPEWAMVLGLHYTDSDGVRTFCDWLREGAFEIEL